MTVHSRNCDRTSFGELLDRAVVICAEADFEDINSAWEFVKNATGWTGKD